MSKIKLQRYGRLKTVLFFLVALVVLGLIFQTQAQAQTCMQNVYWALHLPDKQNTQALNCTANDIQIAEARNIRDIDGNPLERCIEGQPISFFADFYVWLTAQTRYDIGLYFATDGDPNDDGALEGVCSANVIRPLGGNPALGSANFINLDPAPDVCGDINSTNNPQVVTVRVDNVLCKAKPGTTELSLPNCTSWRQPGSNRICQTAYDAYPGSPSKCNCDIGFTVPIIVDTLKLKVTKDASPDSRPEPGGDFTYDIGIKNEAKYTDVILDRICDDKFGEIVYNAGSACPTGNPSPATSATVVSTNCTLPQILTPGDTYNCQFVGNLIGDPASTSPLTVPNKVTVTGHDPSDRSVEGTASASVQIADVPPTALLTKSLVDIKCAVVEYKVKVENTNLAQEDLVLTSLYDSGFGSITSVHDDVKATTCNIGTGIIVKYGPANAYECTFDGFFCGRTHANTVTGTLNDNEGNVVNPTGNLTVGVSAIEITD